MMDAESVILSATRQYLRLKGWMVIRHQQGSMCQPGIPDLSAIRNGRTIYLECKSPKWRGKLSKDQEKFKAELEQHGATFLIIDSVDAMIWAVDKLTKEAV
jgi:Holliday junction resolvase